MPAFAGAAPVNKLARHAEPATAASFDEQVILLMARHGAGVRLAVFLALALLAAMALPSHPLLAPAWLVLVILTLSFRWWALRRLAAATHLPITQRLRMATGLSLLNGIVQSLCLVFTPEFTEYERAVQSVLLLGICTGAVASTGGYRPVFMSYLLPVLLPLAGTWAFLRAGESEAPVRLAMAALVLMFGVALVGLARDGFRLFSDLWAARQQQAQANALLADALAEAEAANRAKTRFLAAASHDLRQPLHTLTLFGAALLHRPLDDDAKRIAGHMQSALQALASQMDALLDVSKLDADVVEVRFAPVSLHALAQRLEIDFRPLAQRKGLQWTVQVPPQARARTDALLIERLLRNLIDNAVKYTDAGGIELRVQAGPAGWEVRVSDSGRGIAHDEQQRVFEEFYQLDNPEHDRAKGLGLGLSIVKRLAHLLQMPIDMQSTPGRGTTMSFTLPRLDEPSTPIAEPVAPEPEPTLEGLTVLVIDDEEDVRRGMATLIEALGGRALLACGASQAMQAVERTRPDVVVADFRLVGGDDGLRIISELRARIPGLRALLVSGDTTPDRLRQARDAHIRLLHKPVDTAQLLKELVRLDG